MKKVFFIGNRLHALDCLLKRRDQYSIVELFILENSPLHQVAGTLGVGYTVFTESKADKQLILERIAGSEFDMLVSNGCPFILPASAIQAAHPDALLINVHPTYLPHLKGKTPLNGVFYLGYDFIGATAHYINDQVDEGNIIVREKVELTPDIDQGLVYFISFQLEAVVFEKALRILEDNQYRYLGFRQETGGSTFNRRDEQFVIDFSIDSVKDIVRKVRSVGILSQGIRLSWSGREYHVWDAEPISNQYLNSLFPASKPGELLLVYSNHLLVQASDGVVKLTYA